MESWFVIRMLISKDQLKSAHLLLGDRVRCLLRDPLTSTWFLGDSPVPLLPGERDACSRAEFWIAFDDTIAQSPSSEDTSVSLGDDTKSRGSFVPGLNAASKDGNKTAAAAGDLTDGKPYDGTSGTSRLSSVSSLTPERGFSSASESLLVFLPLLSFQ